MMQLVGIFIMSLVTTILGKKDKLLCKLFKAKNQFLVMSLNEKFETWMIAINHNNNFLNTFLCVHAI